MNGQSIVIEGSAPLSRRLQSAVRLESLESLELRLIDGYHRIDVAQAQGEDVSAWEDFWIDLLHRYESMCDGVKVAA